MRTSLGPLRAALRQRLANREVLISLGFSEILQERKTVSAQPQGDEENEPISTMSRPVEFEAVQTQQSQNGGRDEYATRPRPAL